MTPGERTTVTKDQALDGAEPVSGAPAPPSRETWPRTGPSPQAPSCWSTSFFTQLLGPLPVPWASPSDRLQWAATLDTEPLNQITSDPSGAWGKPPGQNGCRKRH